MGRYRTIVADPPWEMSTGGPGWWENGDHPVPYSMMDFRDICRLPVRKLCEDDAHLYLWTTNRWLRKSFYLLELWGFRFSTCLVWAKSPHGIGPGSASGFTLTTEFCLFGRRGTLAAKTKLDTTWWQWKRGAHSAKPEAFLDLVEQVSPGPYFELFARRQRLGWDTWGNEALEHVDLLNAAQQGEDPSTTRRAEASLSRG